MLVPAHVYGMPRVNAMSQEIWQRYDKLVDDHLKLVGGACSARAVNGRSKNEAGLAAVLLLTWEVADPEVRIRGIWFKTG
jgi:hypothetical protein